MKAQCRTFDTNRMKTSAGEEETNKNHIFITTGGIIDYGSQLD